MHTHTTSLDLSKRLKELGVPQVGYFSWYRNIPRDQMYLVETYDISRPEEAELLGSAFLASELMNKLPEFIIKEDKYIYNLNIYFRDTVIVCYSCEDIHLTDHFSVEDDNPVEALGLMLCYLLENKLVDLNSLNK